MAEWKLWEGEPPVYSTADWYAQRDRAPHAEQDGHQQRLKVTANLVIQALALNGGQGAVVDLGAGDGGLLQMLADRGFSGEAFPMWGYDLQPSNIKGAADRGVTVEYLDILTQPHDWGAITVASELLEHLVDPRALLREIATHSRFLVASSPYTETDEHHYEHHLFAWDRDGYRQLLESEGWRVLDVRTAWISQIVLAETTR